MSANATPQQVSSVLRALGDSQLLDTVLKVDWQEGTVSYGALEYELSAPREELVEALTAFLNE